MKELCTLRNSFKLGRLNIIKMDLNLSRYYLKGDRLLITCQVIGGLPKSRSSDLPISRSLRKFQCLLYVITSCLRSNSIGSQKLKLMQVSCRMANKWKTLYPSASNSGPKDFSFVYIHLQWSCVVRLLNCAIGLDGCDSSP